MGKCKDCKWWKEDKDMRYDPIYIYAYVSGRWGCCRKMHDVFHRSIKHKNLMLDKYVKPECGGYPEDLELWVGANFGCIHFERRGK